MMHSPGQDNHGSRDTLATHRSLTCQERVRYTLPYHSYEFIRLSTSNASDARLVRSEPRDRAVAMSTFPICPRKIWCHSTLCGDAASEAVSVQIQRFGALRLPHIKTGPSERSGATKDMRGVVDISSISNSRLGNTIYLIKFPRHPTVPPS